MLGNEFDSYRGGFADYQAFGGELFKVKLNVFDKELDAAEVKDRRRLHPELLEHPVQTPTREELWCKCEAPGSCRARNMETCLLHVAVESCLLHVESHY